MAQRRLSSDLSLPVLLHGRWRFVLRRPLSVLILLAAFAQLMPMGFAAKGGLRPDSALGACDVTVATQVAIAVCRPVGQSIQIAEDRDPTIKQLDFASALFGTTDSGQFAWDATRSSVGSSLGYPATLVDLHVRLQI